MDRSVALRFAGLIAGIVVVIAGLAAAAGGFRPPRTSPGSAIPATTAGATSPATAHMHVVGPSCSHIDGDEIGANARWRIVEVFSNTTPDLQPGEKEPVIACDPRTHGQARIRVLGHTLIEDEDPDEGGPYEELAGLAGDRAVIEADSYDDRGNLSASTFTLVDLARGTRTVLGGPPPTADRANPTELGDETVSLSVTGRGGLAYQVVRPSGSPRRFHAGPSIVWDARGRRSIGLADASLVASHGRGGNTEGVYYRTAAGRVGRIPVRGAASTARITPDPALAWRSSLGLVSAQPEPQERASDGIHQLLRVPSTFGDETNTVDSGPWAISSRDIADPTTTVRITADFDGEQRIATMAPGAGRGLRTLSQYGYATTFLAGRFVEHGGQRRIRLVLGSRAARAFFDVPATPAIERRGGTAVTSGAEALTDGHTVRLWTHAHGGSIHTIEGAHDLAFDDGRTAGLFVTDGAGRVHDLRA